MKQTFELFGFCFFLAFCELFLRYESAAFCIVSCAKLSFASINNPKAHFTENEINLCYTKIPVYCKPKLLYFLEVLYRHYLASCRSFNMSDIFVNLEQLSHGLSIKFISFKRKNLNGRQKLIYVNNTSRVDRKGSGASGCYLPKTWSDEKHSPVISVVIWISSSNILVKFCPEKRCDCVM